MFWIFLSLFISNNIQHTPRAQAAIFERLAAAGNKRGYHQDWIDANLWIAKAKYNSTYSVAGDDKIYNSLQGMFSGTRSTDFINTLLNLCYF